MREIIPGLIACAVLGAAAAQTPSPGARIPQQATGDFDGDAVMDWAGWVAMGNMKCALQVSLGGKPGSVYTLVLADVSDCNAPIEVLQPGTYATTGVGVPASSTFEHDVILTVSRPNVRGLSYWNGKTFSGTWIPN
jgi:hypothetical protein